MSRPRRPCRRPGGVKTAGGVKKENLRRGAGGFLGRDPFDLARVRTLIDAYRDHIPRQLRRPNLFLFAESSAIELDTDVFALTWHNAAGNPTRLTL